MNASGRVARYAVAVLLVGVLAAAFAIAFRLLLRYGLELILGTPNVLEGFAALPWYLRLGLPAAGGGLAAAISLLAARSPGGHGVAVILESVVLGRGQIRLPAVLLKSAASLVALCTGASIGREGSIIQFGGGSGSLIGRFFRMPSRETRMLVAAGTGAGFAAAYNTPFAAVLFVVEIVTGILGVDILVPVAAAIAVATTLTRLAIGGGPIYGKRTFALVTQEELAAHCVLGLLAGLIGPAFLLALSKAEDFVQRFSLPRLAWGTLGGLGVGLIALRLPAVTGNGYEAIQLILDARLAGAVLAVLLVAKAAATVSSVSSGSPGGVFTPSLFLGAALGGLVGWAVPHVLVARGSAAEVGGYALAGMAALIAATTHAPLMAAALAFELSGDYALVIPLLAGTTIAALVSRRLRPDSIYTEELRRRGIPWRGSLTERLAHAVIARDILTMDPPTVAADASVSAALLELQAPNVRVVYVPGPTLRAIDLNDAKRLWAAPDRDRLRVDEVAHPVAVVSPQDSLLDLGQKLWSTDWGELPVCDQGKLLGVVSRRALLGALDAEVLHRDVLLTRVVRFDAGRESGDFFELPADRHIEEIAVPRALWGAPLRAAHPPGKIRGPCPGAAPGGRRAGGGDRSRLPSGARRPPPRPGTAGRHRGAAGSPMKQAETSLSPPHREAPAPLRHHHRCGCGWALLVNWGKLSMNVPVLSNSAPPVRLWIMRIELVAAFCLLVALPAGALQPLDAFLASARTRSPDALEAQAGLAQQQAQEDVALGRVLPGIAVRGSITRNQYDVFFDAPGQRVTIVPLRQLDGLATLTVPLFDAAGFTRVSAARAAAGAAGQQLAAARLQIESQVTQDYYQLIANLALVTASQRALEVSKESLHLAQARYDAGSGPVLDLDRARADVEAQTQQVALADLQVSLAARALESASELAPEGSAAPALDDDLHAEPPLASFDSDLERLPGVAAAAGNTRAAEEQAKAQRFALLPVIFGTLTERGTSSPGFTGHELTWQAALAFNWALDFTSFANIRSQDAATGVARAREQRARHLARDAIHRQWETVAAAIARGKSARAGRAAAAHAAEQARDRFQAGASTQLELLQAQRDLFTADVARIQADADLINSRAQLRLAAGATLLAPGVK